MSDTPNNRMDRALRNYAEQRRKDSGVLKDAEMPARMREVLATEVKKRYPQSGSHPATWLTWMSWFIRPAGLGALSACAVLVIGTLILRHESPAPTIRLDEYAHPQSASAPATKPSPTLPTDIPLASKPADSGTRSAKDGFAFDSATPKLAAPVAQPSPVKLEMEARYSQKAPQALPPSSPAVILPTPNQSLLRNVERSPLEDQIGLAADAKTPTPNIRTTQASEAASVASKENRLRDQSGAAAPLLQNFQLEVQPNGSALIIDADGSRYEGTSRTLSTLSRRPSIDETTKRSRVLEPKRQLNEGLLAEQERLFVKVQGTNRSSKQLVTVEGELDRNQFEALQKNQQPGFAAGDVSKSTNHSSVFFTQQAPQNITTTNAQFRGYLQIPDQPRATINAVGVSQNNVIQSPKR